MLVSVVAACGTMRAGLANDGSSGGLSEDGCDRHDAADCAGGRGYDEVAIAITAVALATLLIPKILRRR